MQAIHQWRKDTTRLSTVSWVTHPAEPLEVGRPWGAPTLAVRLDYTEHPKGVQQVRRLLNTAASWDRKTRMWEEVPAYLESLSLEDDGVERKAQQLVDPDKCPSTPLHQAPSLDVTSVTYWKVNTEVKFFMPFDGPDQDCQWATHIYWRPRCLAPWLTRLKYSAWDFCQ